ncbi:MAG: ABC transporter ATP-binding protein [Thermostichales cyanobacterium SZTDM-1c_bins_54]
MANTTPLLRLIRYGKAYTRQGLLAVMCSILNKIFDLAPPALIGAAIDVVVQGQNSWLARWGIPSVGLQFVVLCGVSVLIWVGESLFQYAQGVLWRNLSQSLEHQLRLHAYEHTQSLPLAYFEDRSVGQLMAVLNDDINQLERFLDHGANDLLQTTTTVIVISTAFFLLAPQVAWLAMLPMPLILMGSVWFQGYLAPRYREVREKAGAINSRLAINLSGILTIKSFTTEAYEAERLRQESLAYQLSNRKAIRLSAAFIPLIRMVILMGFIATLGFGGWEASQGRLAAGTYSVMVFLTQRLLWPLTTLGQTLDQYQRAMASTRRVMELLDTPTSSESGGIPLPRAAVRGELRLEQVTFAYRERLPVLQEVNLQIPAGQTIGIVGATGSGKSTLIKLVLRLYEIQGGRITLDGQDIRQLNVRDLRRCIGLVSQDVFLFNGTIRDNIAYGSFGASLEEIRQAATIAEADEFICRLPQGYDTLIGERGQKLSGGQQQRLAIARAVLKDPPILILDEATSAVDNETEAAIQRSLAKITRHRTTIIIAHRLSTVRHADCIYVLDRGRLVEWGQHEPLLAQKGIYYSLWQVQTGNAA